jgi:hypothetical protein
MLNKLRSIDIQEDDYEDDQFANGTQVFTEEDVFKTNNMLSRLMRAIFVSEKVTIQEIASKQKEFLIKMDADPSNFSTAKTNLIAALCRSSVSFNKFYEAIVDILGYKMDITITLTKKGETKNYKYSKIVPSISKRI